jgi:hypothetical protein
MKKFLTVVGVVSLLWFAVADRSDIRLDTSRYSNEDSEKVMSQYERGENPDWIFPWVGGAGLVSLTAAYFLTSRDNKRRKF